MESAPPDRPAPVRAPGAGGWALLIALAVGAAYWPALRGGLLWDDDAHITKPALRSLHGLARIWTEVGATQQYYPVLHTAFWIEHRIWGGSVLGYHLVGLLLHACAAWLVVLILRRLEFPASGLAGLFFALHPVCVESVAWISEQKNTLSAVFYLLAALCYLRWDAGRRPPDAVLSEDERARRPRAAFSPGPWRGYLFATTFFVLSLLTKSVTATLPAALLVIVWWRQGRLSWRRDVRPLVPWFLFGATIGLFTSWVERRYIGASGPDFALGAVQRLLLSAKIVVFYLGKLVWPADLMFIYPRWRIDPTGLAAYLPLVLVLAAAAALAWVARRRRGPLAGFLFFVGTLFPALGFFNVYPFLFSYVADHFQYLACLGVLVPLAWAVNGLGRRMRGLRGAGLCLVLALPAGWGWLSHRQAATYRDAETLYRATLARNPDAWLAHYNLAVLLGDQGRTGEAIAEYQEVVRLRPEHWAARANLASALLRVLGRTQDAIGGYEEALRIHPDFPEAENDLGVALERDPVRAPEAEGHFRKALQLKPDFDGAWNNLGVFLLRRGGSLEEAIADFEKAVRLAPGDPEYRRNLADALSDAPGRLEEAVGQYDQALKLKPDYVEARGNLAVAYIRLGRLAEAETELRRVIALRPDMQEARRLLERLEAAGPSP